jgi:hypothetical protein
VQSKVEEKPNIATLPKLRCSHISRAIENEVTDVLKGTHSHNLL